MLRIGRRNDIAADWLTDGLTPCGSRAKAKKQFSFAA